MPRTGHEVQKFEVRGWKRFLARDLREGRLEEYFIDGTFVIAKRKALGWERPSMEKERKLMAIEKGTGLPISVIR